ncbi:MAG: transglutaminase family protein, partial [Dehalococcoidia bacterium]|nr:transglutaminase family protein [Dehalococcoidia bacterium]
MFLRVGYDFTYECPARTPMVLLLNIHHSRASDIIVPDHLTVSPSVPVETYRDAYGNWCSRLVAPAGTVRLTANAIVRDSGLPDVVVPTARQYAVEDLPSETLQFLLPS